MLPTTAKAITEQSNFKTELLQQLVEDDIVHWQVHKVRGQADHHKKIRDLRVGKSGRDWKDSS